MPSVRKLSTIALALALTLTGLGPSSASSDRDFRVQWEPHQGRGGSAIGGYVYNDAGMPAARVSVLVEGLDASGRPTSTTIGYVGTVPALGRTSFDVRVPSAVSYRVRVSSYDWVKGGGV